MSLSTQSPLASEFAEETVGSLVAGDFRRAHVFSQFGIDFCCGGKRTLAKACDRAGIALVEVEAALQAVKAEGMQEDSLNQLPLGQLIDYIEATHHDYVREKAPLLIEYSQKMVRAHGEHYDEIKPFAGWVRALIEDLMPHLMKEEQILFPAIRAMAAGEQVSGCFGHIGNPINAMEHEHDEASEIVERLRALTNDFTPPPHACTTWRICYATLKEFVADLQQHIHIENNILFPKTLAI
ncbi:iron-sulfur cluster repair di-iron protein [Shewanella spartinae]|uniref:iron-sulfur cluster repair di-iron protein n=1 Tax=Shewanella spartinae TaxID=2864205 RepID=UPI001C65CDCB|nr:iron-sulfur cluster repair di-iron protein [Shewanella spartinae]QYJ94132.1 iron-sulfur cluster repair di-iron protein [Shewanella spartinae]